MKTKTKIILSLSLILFSISISFFAKLGFLNHVLHHIGTILILLLMILDIRNPATSYLGFLGLWIFALLHVIGATWLYSSVPYNEWFINLFSFNINEYFGWTRNHFDRLVHFMFGLLLLPYLKDLVIKVYRINSFYALMIGFLLLQTFSMVYELFEWGIAITMSEGNAERYNGQQGDNWDAIKDMALAMIGSIISFFYLRIKSGKERSSF